MRHQEAPVSTKRFRVQRTTDDPRVTRRSIAYFTLDAAWRAAEQYARFDRQPVEVTEDGEVIATYTLVGTEVEVTTP